MVYVGPGRKPRRQFSHDEAQIILWKQKLSLMKDLAGKGQKKEIIEENKYHVSGILNLGPKYVFERHLMMKSKKKNQLREEK